MATKVKKRKERQKEYAKQMGFDYEEAHVKEYEKKSSSIFKSPKEWDENTWKWFLFGITILLLGFIFKFGKY